MRPPELLVIDEEPTDPEFGSKPRDRTVEGMLRYGLIALDKPRGPTSHEVVAWVRRLLGVDRAGHSGTLDPPVSGLLPIGLGEGTKALSLLLLFPKEYWAVMRLHSAVPRGKVETVLREFTGEIYQRPPQRSAVRRDVRTRTIYGLDLVEAKGNLYLLRCLCQAGTYVRKLIYDVGEVLEVGGTMVELRRTKVGPLVEEDGFVTLHQLNDAAYRLKAGEESPIKALVRPIVDCVGSVKRVVVSDSAVDAICHGARLAVPGVLAVSRGVVEGETLALMSAKGELVAIGKALMSTDKTQASAKGLVSTVERVIMKQGTYPKMWKHKDKAKRSPNP